MRGWPPLRVFLFLPLLAGCPPCDRDGDGHEAESCGGDDCDDGNAAVYPGAPEVCGDGVHNSCRPAGAACGPWGDLTVDQAVAEIGFESDGLTEPSVAALGDWDGDGLGDLAVGNRIAGTGMFGFGSGKVWLHRGPLEGTVWPGDAFARFVAEDDEAAGSALELLDLSGSPVLAIGMEDRWIEGVGPVGMVAFVRPEGRSGDVPVPADLPAVLGLVDLDKLGRFLGSYPLSAATGDALLLLYLEGGLDEPGGLVLLDVVPAEPIARSDLPVLFDNDLPGMTGFMSVAAIPGDAGHPDWIFVGLPRLQLGTGNATTGTLVGFPLGTDTVTTTTAPLRLEGPQVGGDGWGDYFGWRMAAADLDGDGTTDLAVFAPRHMDEDGRMHGAAHVLFGRWDAEGWTVDDRALLVPEGPLWLRGLTDDADMDLVGDLNGDGHPELVIGSNWSGWDSSWYGCAYLFYGPIGRDASFSDVDATICGVHQDEGVGNEVEAGGDLDGDGYDDLLIASRRAVYVFPGGPGP